MKAIKLPWPPKELSPNARKHWRAKAPIAAKYKNDCMMLFTGVRLRQGDDGPLRLHFDFYPPDRRHRDDDNLIASMKYARDGIAMAVGINDRRFQTVAQIMDETGGYVMAWLS